MTFTAYVDVHGTLKINDYKEFRRLMQTKYADTTVLVHVDKRKNKRTLDQNAYWHAVPVKELAEHCGYTPSQMHYALLGECFGYRAGPAGHVLPIKPSSSDLSIEEFSHLIDWVLTWAPAELGVTLEPPTHWMERHGDTA